MSCLCPDCLFGDTSECPNKNYSGTWIRYDIHTGKKVTDPEFCNKHWCRNDDCTESSDVGSSLQSPPVMSNLQSCPTSPSVTSSNHNSDLDFNEHTVTPVEPDLDTRILMCQNFGALRDLFSSQEPFDPLQYTVAKMSRCHRLDTDALQYKPTDAPKVTLQCRSLGMAIASVELWPLQ